MKQDRYRLGYKSNAKARSKMMKMKRERKMASLMGAIVEEEHIVSPHVHETFYSVGVEYDSVIIVSRSTWVATKINRVATNLFCTGVIGHPGYMFLN